MTTPSDGFADEPGQSARGAEGVSAGRLSACERFDAVAAELALGSLTGAARSSALSHLDGCEDCRGLIEELSAAADALLLAAPEADAPAGFEVRWLARIKPDTTASAAALAAPQAADARHGAVIPLRGRLRMIVAAAAAAIVLAGAGVGLGVAVGRQPGTQVRLAALRSGSAYLAAGVPVGEVAITTGSPSWVIMTYDKPGWSGQVQCIVTEHGQTKDVGTFWLHNGMGSWAVRLPAPGASVTSAEVRGLTGSVLATATFST